MTWREIQAPQVFLEVWANNNPGVPPPKVYDAVAPDGILRALVGREPLGTTIDGDPDWRWHISISGEDRVPTWEEMSASAHALRPGVVFTMGVPPESWWINVHEFTLHMHEIKDPNLVAQWQWESRGDQRT